MPAPSQELKLPAASCRESSILKVVLVILIARLPHSKLRGMRSLLDSRLFERIREFAALSRGSSCASGKELIGRFEAGIESLGRLFLMNCFLQLLPAGFKQAGSGQL